MVENKTDLKHLGRYIRKIASRLKLDRAILFGSRACGVPTPESDYDIILVSSDFEGKKFYKRPAGLYLAWGMDVPVDLICLTPEEFEDKAKRATVVRHAVQNGVQLI